MEINANYSACDSFVTTDIREQHSMTGSNMEEKLSLTTVSQARTSGRQQTYSVSTTDLTLASPAIGGQAFNLLFHDHLQILITWIEGKKKVISVLPTPQRKKPGKRIRKWCRPTFTHSLQSHPYPRNLRPSPCYCCRQHQ